jgi:F-type H+-transporting ATPase subunit alpha
VGISVSRVGSKAQTSAMKKVAGRLKLDMGQYREVAAFAQFGTSELDKATLAQLERGQRIQEVLKQNQYTPVSLEKEVMILYAVISGLISDIPVDKVTAFEAGLNQFLDANYAELGKSIAETKELTDATEETLKKAINEFKQGFVKS